MTRRRGSEQFRRLAAPMSFWLLAEATRNMPTKPATVRDAVGATKGRRFATNIVVVPVLRAGLGMLDAVLEMLPEARVGHIGLQRDESTAMAWQCCSKVPRRPDRHARADGRPDAGHGRQRGRRAQSVARRRRHRHPPPLHRRRARRRRGVEASAPRRSTSTRRSSIGPQPAQIHRPRPRRLRRSSVRHVERSAVTGRLPSRPRLATIGVREGRRPATLRLARPVSALGSAVEHRLHTAGVSGSNPLARTNSFPCSPAWTTTLNSRLSIVNTIFAISRGAATLRA